MLRTLTGPGGPAVEPVRPIAQAPLRREPGLRGQGLLSVGAEPLDSKNPEPDNTAVALQNQRNGANGSTVDTRIIADPLNNAGCHP